MSDTIDLVSIFDPFVTELRAEFERSGMQPRRAIEVKSGISSVSARFWKTVGKGFVRGI